MTSLSNKFISLILSFTMLLSFSACSSKKEKAGHTAEEANQYLTDFFSDYNSMNTYLKRADIAVSAFALDGAGLSAILRALYQSQNVTFAFPEPVPVEENVYQTTVTVFSIDIAPLFSLYNIDREIAVMEGTELSGDFVAEKFYSNMLDNINTKTKVPVTLTVRVSDDGTWSIDSSNELAFAIFPNIQNT